jgi:hypothetical protein
VVQCLKDLGGQQIGKKKRGGDNTLPYICHKSGPGRMTAVSSMYRWPKLVAPSDFKTKQASKAIASAALLSVIKMFAGIRNNRTSPSFDRMP